MIYRKKSNFFSFLILLGVASALTTNSFADVIVRGSDGKSDQILRASTQSEVMYFQTCNSDGQECVPFGSERGYPLSEIKKMQKRVHLSEAVELGGGIVPGGLMSTALWGVAFLAITAPPIGVALAAATIIGEVGGVATVIGLEHATYVDFNADHRMGVTLKLGQQEGEDDVITVPSIEQYESNLLALLQNG